MKNPPAFPRAAFYAPGTVEDGLYNGPEEGMDLRDYFAAQAIQLIGFDGGGDPLAKQAKRLAEKCYLLADAMLEAREQ